MHHTCTRTHSTHTHLCVTACTASLSILSSHLDKTRLLCNRVTLRVWLTKVRSSGTTSSWRKQCTHTRGPVHAEQYCSTVNNITTYRTTSQHAEQHHNMQNNDVVETHCYFVDIGRTDREPIHSRINNNDCRTFRPRRPLSTVYKTTWMLTSLYNCTWL